MTYRELLLQAELKLDHNDITLGEFEQMIAPLNREIDVLDNLRTEIEDERIDIDLDLGEEVYYNKAIDDVLQIIDKYRNEVSE